MKKAIIFAIIILFLPIVFAAPPGSLTAYGGNISEVAIIFTQRTPDWQGYAGIITYGTGPTAPTTVNATGSNVTSQGLHFQIPCNNPTSIKGFVLFSNSSSIPAGLVPGNLAILDTLIPGDESGTKTFTQTSTFNFPSAGTVNNVPTTHTYINQQPQNTTFREGYLNDAAGNLVFATEINFVPKPGYNLSSFSYQVMVAAPNYTTVPYYIFTDLNAVCPRPTPGGGGGGAGRQYPETWGCTNWSICINNIQTRNCTQLVYNQYYSSGYFPPTERMCGMITTKMPSYNITIEEFPLQAILDNITILLPRIKVLALNQNNIQVEIQNDNFISLENLGLELDIPEIITKYIPIHQFKNVLWDSVGLHGWSLRNRLQTSYPWEIKSERFRMPPKSRTIQTIEITPPAVMPQTIESVFTLLLGNIEAKTETVPTDIEVKEFDAGYDYNPQTNVLALFFIVDNRGKPVMKNAFIEFNLNNGRKTTIAELYGPYNFPEDKVTILAQEYKLSKGLIGKEFEMKANINNGKYSNEVKRKCIISG